MKISEGSKFIFIATSSKHLEDRFFCLLYTSDAADEL